MFTNTKVKSDMEPWFGTISLLGCEARAGRVGAAAPSNSQRLAAQGFANYAGRIHFARADQNTAVEKVRRHFFRQAESDMEPWFGTISLFVCFYGLTRDHSSANVRRIGTGAHQGYPSGGFSLCLPPRRLFLFQHPVGHLPHQGFGQLSPELNVIRHGIFGNVLSGVGQEQLFILF